MRVRLTNIRKEVDGKKLAVERLGYVVPSGGSIEVDIRSQREFIALNSCKYLRLESIAGGAAAAQGGGDESAPFATVAKGVEAINASDDIEQLEEWLEREEATKDRVGITTAIESRIAELEAEADDE